MNLSEKEWSILISLLQNDINKRERKLVKRPFTPEEGKLNVQEVHIEKRTELLQRLKDFRSETAKNQANNCS